MLRRDHRSRARLRSAVGAALVVGLIAPQALALAPSELLPVGVAIEKRSFPISEFGVAHPKGMALLTGGDTLVLAETARNGTALAGVTTAEDQVGSMALPALAGSVALAVDPVRHQLAALDASALLVIDEKHLWQKSAPVERMSIKSLGIGDARGAAFGSHGALYVLDARARELVVLDEGPSAPPPRIPLVHLGETLRGLAVGPGDGLFYIVSVDRRLLYGIDGNGLVTAAYDLSEIEASDVHAIALGPSADPTDEPDRISVYIAAGTGARSGDDLIEATLRSATDPEPDPLPATTEVASLLKTIDLSALSTPSSDPSGVAWDSARSRFIVSDGEIEEPNLSWLYQDVNLFEISRAGAYLGGGTTSHPNPKQFSDEPVGAAFDPATRTLIISDDDQDDVSFVKAGTDGRYGNADDTVTEVNARTHTGSGDPEGIAFDTHTGHLFISDGVGSEVYHWNPGPDKIFGNADDVHNHWDMSRYGAKDPEAIAYFASSQTLLVLDKASIVYEVDKTGVLLRTIDASATNASTPAGIEVAPSSADVSKTSMWIVDRAVDNDSDSSENDGKLFELSLGPGAPANASPTVTITAPVDGSNVAEGATISFTATATDPESGNVASSLVWTSDKDGQIGTGASFSRTLPAGSHVITATATDGGGATGSDTVSITVGDTITRDIVLAANSDDAEQTNSSGAVALSSSDLELGFAGSTAQTVGMRFVAPIPKNAFISNAYVQFRVDEATTAATSLLIQGQAADNAATFTTATNNISSRARTSASVAWTPPGWPTVLASGPDQRTPNLASIIQEIVNRTSWASGNALALIVTGTGSRVADSIEGGGAPVLHVEYSATPPAGPPQVQITSPADGSSHAIGASISFAGSASDQPDGNLSANLVWTSNNDSIGSGASFSTSLSEGTHLITASVTDTNGNRGSASITITVANQAPVVTITAPANGSSSSYANAITFTGSASDAEDGTISTSLAWTSSIEGAIGTGGSFSTNLRVGSHTITASVSDTGGKPGSASVTITVVNNTPTVTITSPSNGSNFTSGNGITFSGSASDTEDGTISASIAWTSSMNGPLGTGASIVANLSNGFHTITASVTDSKSATGSTSIAVTVGATPQTVAVAVAANSDDAEQTVSGGAMNLSSSDLEMGFAGSTAQTVGMRFVAPIPKNAFISNAYVQFRVDEATTAATSLVIEGQAADNAATFTTAVSNISSRARTSASVAWNPPGWPTVLAAGPDQRTPNLASIVQEIVNRTNWASGNALALIVTGTGSRVADSIEGGGAPVLHVEYSATPPAGPPQVQITSPADGSSHAIGASISFAGSASDQPDGNLSANLVWTSDNDSIGSGASFSTSLSEGTHLITASVTDTNGNRGSASITITVANQAPVVTITAPANGATFTSGTGITFTGSASDAEDGSLSASIAWSSSINDSLGTGASIVANLSNGFHTITASVTDSKSARGSTSIAVTVGATPQTLTVAVATGGNDAEENASTGAMDLASSDLELVTDKTIVQRVGMRFLAAIPKGAQITNAYIQFRVDEVSSGAVSLVVRGQAADNAATFTSAVNNIGSRALTSATVPWAPPDWPTVGAAGPDQRTPNLSSIIQEIVNRANWASGNGLVLVVTGSGRRTAYSFEGGAAGAAVLHVEYLG